MSLDNPLNGEQQAPTEPSAHPLEAPVEEMSPLTAPLQRVAGELEAVTSVEEPMHASGEPRVSAEEETSEQAGTSEQARASEPMEQAAAPAQDAAAGMSEQPGDSALAAGPSGAEPPSGDAPSSEGEPAPEATASPEAPVPPASEPAAPAPVRAAPTRPGLASLAQVFEAERSEEAEAAPEEALVSEATLLRRRGETAPALIALDRIDEDTTFQVRPVGDISRLATDIARVGQLFPVEVRLLGPDRFQVVCGFRRVAAMRFLQREVVLARLHTELSDEDALLMALAAAIHAEPVPSEELESVRERLQDEGRLFAAARDMLDKALQSDDSLAPEGVEEEVDADELAADAAQRLGAINQDLSLLADVFLSLDESRRAELLMQLRYSSELVTYLEGLKG